MSEDLSSIRAAEVRAGRWELTGSGELSLINDFLGYVADRGYSPRTVRAYAFDLLHFARWLAEDDTGLDAVDTDVLLRYLAANRAQRQDGQHENVIPLTRGTAFRIRPGHDQPAPGGDLGPVRLPVDARPGRCESGTEGSGGTADRPRRAHRPARSSGQAEASVEAAGPRAAAAAARPGPRRDRRAAGQLPHRPGPGDRRADAAVRAALG